MNALRQSNTWAPPCPLCLGTEFKSLAYDDRYGMRLQTAGCLNCGLLQTWPRPTPEAMANFYRDEYRKYYQATIVPDAGYATRYHKDERLAYTAKLLSGSVCLKAGMRVLDIGCAEGTLFVKLAETCSELHYFGVEPSKAFADYARKRTGCVTYPDLETLSAAGVGEFDLIILNHVLEHTDDPVSLLRRLVSLLSSSGSLYVDVPNADRYSNVDSLHIAHLFHFSPRTLRAAMVRAGYRVMSLESHQPPHHPSSVWCLATSAVEPMPLETTNVETERIAWAAIEGIRRSLPLHSLRRRLARNRLAAGLVRALRILRSRISG